MDVVVKLQTHTRQLLPGPEGMHWLLFTIAYGMGDGILACVPSYAFANMGNQHSLY
jgi:hypothetical protein